MFILTLFANWKRPEILATSYKRLVISPLALFLQKAKLGQKFRPVVGGVARDTFGGYGF